jgi:pimeloyl-ACP methyl ester carboxylesterase
MKASSLLLAMALLPAGACASAGGSAASDLPPAPTAIVEEEAALTTATGNIAGTLELPASKFPVPVVVIIAGSGPTDRNGNSAVIPGRNNSLKMLADGLAARGIATVRYDKRGIAGSRAAAAREDDLRFTHFISDASDWIRKLRADRRFSTITVAGHSEGSLIGMVAAREAGADGYVSIAGVGRKATEILIEQLKTQLSPEVLAQTTRIMESIEKGQEPDSVPSFLNALFRPSVRPYLKSWFAYSPAEEIARLTVPVLIIQGTTDVQVKVEDASRLAQAKPGSKLVVIDGMNHVLKTAQGTMVEQMPSYSNPDLPVVPSVIDEIAGFVKTLKR